MKRYWLLLSMFVSLFVSVPSSAGTLRNYPDGDWYTRNGTKCDNVVNLCKPIQDDAPIAYFILLPGCTAMGSCQQTTRYLWSASYDILNNPYYDIIVSHLTAQYSQGITNVPEARFYKLDNCVKGSGYAGVSCKIEVSWYDAQGQFHIFSPGTLGTNGIFNNAPCVGVINNHVCVQKDANDNNLNVKLLNDPISLNSKEVIDERVDIKFPIEFSRVYHSSNKQYGNLGFGWTTDIEKSVRIPVLSNPSDVIAFTSGSSSGSFLPPTLLTTLWIQVQDGTNGDLFFTRTEPTSAWTGAFNNYDGYSLTSNGAEYTLTKPNGDINKYDGTSGLLTSENFKNGSYLKYYYSGSKVSQIVNNFNQSISFTYSGDVISQVAASNGDYVTYTYTSDYLTQATFNGSETYSYSYDNNGLMIDKYDENNQHYTHYDYDTQNRPIVNYMFDKDGNQINRSDLNYNNTSYVAETKQNGNVVYHYFDIYNSGSQYTGSVNMVGGNGQYTFENLDYDANGNLTSTYNSLGTANTTYTYDTNNLVKTVKKENGATINMTWDTTKRLLTNMNEQTSNGSRITNYTYDDYNNVKSKTVQGNNETLAWNYTYSNDGRILNKTDPNGLSYTYAYYPVDNSPTSGLVQSITTNTGKVITINSYDTRGNATSITGIDGITKSMSYDIRGRLTSESVNNATNNYTYDGAGNLITSSFANGYILTMTYDPANRLTKIEDNMGGAEEFVLDATTGKPLNTNIYQNSILIKTMNQVLNNAGQTIKTYRSDINKAFVVNSLYNDGSINSAQDQNGTAISRKIDKQGLTTTNNYAGDYPDFTYDLDNNLNSVNVNAQVTNYTYDDFGRLTKLISPDTGTQTVTYNTASNTKTRTDANNTTHRTTTDIEGKVTSIVHSGSGSTLNETYEYNLESRLKKVSDNSGSTEFEYDTYGYLNKKTQTINNVSLNVLYENNNLGQTVSVTYPSGMVVNYAYDKGYLTNIYVGSNNIVNNVTYNSLEKQPVSWTLGNNAVTITRNLDGAMTNFVDNGVLNQSLTVDSMLNVKAISDSANSKQNITANYNANYSISSFTSSLGYQTQATGTNYNISSVSGNGENSSWSYLTNTNKINASTANPSVAYLYDLNGNVKLDNKGSYVYDLKNNLITSNRNQLTGTYTFNALNQRVAKNVSGQLRYFVYNESNQLIGEYDSSGNVINEYIYFGLRPVAVNNGGNISIVHTDYLGTPRYVTDSSNNVLWKWENLDPYGSNIAQGTLEFNLRFAGQYYDSESGLHYNMFRSYDPSSKRYMQSDPMGLNVGWNTYNYVGRNPLSNIDPLGLNGKNVMVVNFYPTYSTVSNKLKDNFPDNSLVIIAEGVDIMNDNDGSFEGETFGMTENYEHYDDLDAANPENFVHHNTKHGKFAGFGPHAMVKILNKYHKDYKKYKKIYLLVCNSGGNSVYGNKKKTLAKAFKDQIEDPDVEVYGLSEYFKVTRFGLFNLHYLKLEISTDDENYRPIKNLLDLYRRIP